LGHGTDRHCRRLRHAGKIRRMPQILNVELVKLDSIKLDPNNARRHGTVDIAAIAESLAKFGQRTPIVVDSDGVILKGNGTYLAAKRLGWSEINVARTELSGNEAKAYAIADNRTAELSEWDDAALIAQMKELEDSLRFATGFGDGELERIAKELEKESEANADALPMPDFQPTSQDGQGKLDVLDPKMIECPHCKQEFDLRSVKQ